MGNINRDSFHDQMQNLNLFLSGKRLSKAWIELYKIIYQKAVRNDNFLINTTVNVLAMSLGRDDKTTTTILHELNRLNLFHKMEIIDGRLIINVKNLESYAVSH